MNRLTQIFCVNRQEKVYRFAIKLYGRSGSVNIKSQNSSKSSKLLFFKPFRVEIACLRQMKIDLRGNAVCLYSGKCESFTKKYPERPQLCNLMIHLHERHSGMKVDYIGHDALLNGKHMARLNVLTPCRYHLASHSQTIFSSLIRSGSRPSAVFVDVHRSQPYFEDD